MNRIVLFLAGAIALMAVMASGAVQLTTVTLPGGVPLEMVAISPGSFQMGAIYDDDNWAHNEEKPVHTVTIGYEFQMGRFELTQRQWLAVMGSWPGWPSEYVPNAPSGLGDNYPAYFVSWDDIRGTNGFLDRLNQHIATTGQGAATFRLPSEAEWEYACRADRATRFCFGDSNCSDALDCTAGRDLADYAWYCGNNGDLGTPGWGTKPVGGKLPNAFGLYDMHGNVFEWCEDWFQPPYLGYTGAPTDGSAWVIPVGSSRLVRGGCWFFDPDYCRSAYRYYDGTDLRSDYTGFRLSRTYTPISGVEPWMKY
jgi:formylglycine-generating enzyme required for sulfatase activity